MSDIEIGSPWFNRCDGVEAVVVSVGSDCIGFTQMVCGKKCFYSHTVEEFKEYYKPLVQADMINHPPHYKDASGVGCTEVVKHMMYFGGACFKYLYRCGNKWDDVEDLKKAVRCAELADDDRFITDESWLRAMYQVASHRDGNIQQAMFSIRCQQWGDVIEDIKAEIARLESE